MPALLKFLVLIAFFLSASNANAFISLSSATGTQVRINHLIRLEKPLSKPTTDQMNDQTTKRLKLVALLPVNQSSKRVMYCDKGKDDEILSKLHNSKNTQPDWHGPNPIGIGQNKRSFKASAHVPFTTIRTNLSSGLTSRVNSHAVKVPVTSTTKVSFSDDADAKTNNTKVSFSNDADKKTNKIPYPSDTRLLPHFNWLLHPLTTSYQKAQPNQTTPYLSVANRTNPSMANPHPAPSSWLSH